VDGHGQFLASPQLLTHQYNFTCILSKIENYKWLVYSYAYISLKMMFNAWKTMGFDPGDRKMLKGHTMSQYETDNIIFHAHVTH
jgi:hypothetical protein